MNSDTLRLIAIGFVCLLAIGFVAGTVNSVQNSASSGYSTFEQKGNRLQNVLNQSTSYEQETNRNDSSNIGTPTYQRPCYPFFGSVTFYGLLGALSVGSFLLFRRLWSTSDGIAVGLFIFLAGALVSFVLAGTCGVGQGAGIGKYSRQIQNITQSPNLGGGGASAYLWGPIIISVIMTIIGAPIMYFMVTRADDIGGEEVTIEEQTDEQVLASLGELAGEAADRLEASATAVDNEVFKAWKEMTEYLHTDHPEASTPTEFEDAAKEVGMESDHVEDLTDLFREVRYGGREATEEREERAIEALRTIEETYADADETDEDEQAAAGDDSSAADGGGA
ncbi:MAG: DUF4129 domain-containing protein [Halobacteriaceae archaeon]